MKRHPEIFRQFLLIILFGFLACSIDNFFEVLCRCIYLGILKQDLFIKESRKIEKQQYTDKA